jgi:hypothetical protein
MITKQIQKVNEVYHIINKNYSDLKKMFKNHKQIVDALNLSEALFHQAIGLVVEKTESIEANREFNRIIKGIKEIK